MGTSGVPNNLVGGSSTAGGGGTAFGSGGSFAPGSTTSTQFPSLGAEGSAPASPGAAPYFGSHLPSSGGVAPGPAGSLTHEQAATMQRQAELQAAAKPDPNLFDTTEFVARKFATLQTSLANMFPFHPDIFLRSVWHEPAGREADFADHLPVLSDRSSPTDSPGPEEVRAAIKSQYNEDEEDAGAEGSSATTKTGATQAEGAPEELSAHKNPDAGGVWRLTAPHIAPADRTGQFRRRSEIISLINDRLPDSEKTGCVLVDVAAADSLEKVVPKTFPSLASVMTQARRNKGGSQSEGRRSVEDDYPRPEEEDYDFHKSLHVLWLHGRGKALDAWISVSPRLCAHYDVVIVEDELLVVAFRDKMYPRKDQAGFAHRWAPGERSPGEPTVEEEIGAGGATAPGSSATSLAGSSSHSGTVDSSSSSESGDSSSSDGGPGTINPPYTSKCKLIPFDSNEVHDHKTFHHLPWAPDEVLPIELQGIPLVSLHAYKVFDREASYNPSKWLDNPDLWTPYFLDLAKNEFLVMCLDVEQCRNDRLPFRLIFTEEIGQEFIDCLHEGVIPIYYLSANLASYLERTLLFMPFFFTNPEEMHKLVGCYGGGDSTDIFSLPNYYPRFRGVYSFFSQRSWN